MRTCLPPRLHIKMAFCQVITISNGFCKMNIVCNKLKLFDLFFSQADTCPECREMVAAKDLRRIYFNFSPMMDSMQTYIDDLNSEIMNIANKLQHVKLQNMKLKNDCSNQLREKDNEIHKLQEFKIKHELQKYQKIKKVPKPRKSPNVNVYFYLFSFPFQAHRARERAK